MDVQDEVHGKSGRPWTMGEAKTLQVGTGALQIDQHVDACAGVLTATASVQEGLFVLVITWFSGGKKSETNLLSLSREVDMRLSPCHLAQVTGRSRIVRPPCCQTGCEYQGPCVNRNTQGTSRQTQD